MRVNLCLALCMCTALVAARRSLHHVGRNIPVPHRQLPAAPMAAQPHSRKMKRQTTTIIPQNANTTKYAVNGSALPDVNFNVGESYAGLMPISSGANSSQLYFWFFPSANTLASDEIVIWMNGGPGCSSLEGLFQENGPVIWQYGTYRPTKNYWTWVNLTNVVWVEQPLGTGFTQGQPTATNEKEVAAQFMGFWKNFIDTFGLQNRKVYVTGESYAGYYVPNIASAMLDQNDTTYYGVEGTMAYDPVVSWDVVGNDIPTLAFVEFHAPLFAFNESYMATIREQSARCGYTDFFNTYLTFPPPGRIPSPPNGTSPAPGCELWNDVFNEVFYTNPCFDVYQVATTCPLLWDVLGFPGSLFYLPEGAEIYFNRSEVQRAINAPIQPWSVCSDGVLETDTSLPSFFDVYPGVIERSKRTIIAHGNLDFVLLANGTLLGIQNMTWGGSQGFSEPPVEDFYVPFHSEASLETLAAAGLMGRTRTERGLTFVENYLSGHMVPQYQPSAAYRQMEYLLGRISSLSERSSFTTQRNGTG